VTRKLSFVPFQRLQVCNIYTQCQEEVENIPAGIALLNKLRTDQQSIRVNLYGYYPTTKETIESRMVIELSGTGASTCELVRKRWVPLVDIRTVEAGAMDREMAAAMVES
jgi:hypothetical protein